MKFHFSDVEIESRYIYRLMNNLNAISIRNLIIENERAKFSIDYTDAESLKEILKNLNIRVVKWEDKGIYTRLVNFAVVKIIVGIFMIFILLMMVNSLFLWNITVEGNYSYSDNQIVSFVQKQNIKEGIIKNKINCDDLEKEIRKKFDDISWVCAEIKGTNLIVHIKENYITEISTQEKEPYNLVANNDATIISILVRKGKAMVKAGDKVKKGDILISGIVEVNDESGQKLFNSYCNSDGDIVGETVYDYSDTLKNKYNQKINNTEKTLYLPSIFNYQWLKPDKKENRDITCTETKIKLFGEFYLPISIQKYTLRSYDIKQMEYTKQEADDILNGRLLDKLAIMEQKGYKIIQKDVKIKKDGDSYVMEGKITCHEPLGKVSYIDINEIEEGTTEINERN